MIRYSWKKIYKKTGRSSKAIVEAFRIHVTKRTRDKYNKYLWADFTGDSYMLNPYELLTFSFKYTAKQLAQYIILASYRNYIDYKLLRDKTLDIRLSPITKKQLLKNPLLTIENNKIHFYYE